MSGTSERWGRILTDLEFLRLLDCLRRGDFPRDVLRLDVIFAHRLLYGRWPSPGEILDLFARFEGRDLKNLVASYFRSVEFYSRKVEQPEYHTYVLAETRDGLRFYFSLKDTYVGIPIAVGVFEPDVTRALPLLVQPGMICVDVGANLGYHTMRMAMIASQGGGHVYSFEPMSFAYNLLKRNRVENRLEQAVTIKQVACGETDQERELCLPPEAGNFGGAYLRRPGEEGTHLEHVRVRPLDDLLPLEARPDLVKIDVEGAELLVLRGMRRILAQDRPVLVIEFNQDALSANGEETAGQLLDLLAEAGYGLLTATDYAEGCRDPLGKDDLLQMQFTNLVALPADRGKARFSQTEEPPPELVGGVVDLDPADSAAGQPQDQPGDSE